MSGSKRSSGQPVVAIDGPAGAGKSTAAKDLAERLGYVLVDTGALYRGVALSAFERSVDWDDDHALGELVESLLLASQRVLPTALQRSGYEFQHETLDGALRAVLHRQ